MADDYIIPHSETPFVTKGGQMPAELKVGQKAPDFTVDADDGGKMKLSELKGKKVVLFFYPKDGTPG
jgi:peroxiredoxin